MKTETIKYSNQVGHHICSTNHNHQSTKTDTDTRERHKDYKWRKTSPMHTLNKNL